MGAASSREAFYLGWKGVKSSFDLLCFIKQCFFLITQKILLKRSNEDLTPLLIRHPDYAVV